MKRIEQVKWTGPLARKVKGLTAWLKERNGVLTAWSGGVDSTFLAVAAHEALGGRALAVTAVSPSLEQDDLKAARALARKWGMRHQVIATDEMANPAFTANPPDRCYHCKSELFGDLRKLARQEKLAVVADGSNADDRGDYRPGTRAAREHAVARPLQDLGFTKADIRAASRALALPTADKPAAACLASRFPYGVRITEEGLEKVARAERAVRRLGFPVCRVRLHGDVGRVEVPAAELDKAFGKRAAIARGVKKAGVRYAALDLEGYRMGSLNEALGKRR